MFNNKAIQENLPYPPFFKGGNSNSLLPRPDYLTQDKRSDCHRNRLGKIVEMIKDCGE